MNKTLMLVICDFLLLSMLALARFDPPEVTPEATLDATVSSATAEAELIELLEESLESELTSRTNLSEDLADTREDLQAKARALGEREATLEETQQSLEAKAAEAEQLAKTKAEIEAEKARLAAEKSEVEADRSQLAERFEDTRTKLEKANSERVQLATTLGQLKEESSVAKERLSQAEEELVAREIALAEREAALKAAEEEKQRLAKQTEALNSQLQVAEAERRILEQNLTQEQREKAAALARADRLGENVSELGKGVTQIGEGVSTIKEASDKIQKEIEASRPQTMSQIFTRFQKNRATIRFTSMEKPLIGSPVQRTYESKSILITDTEGTTYLVTHTDDTPFAFSKNPNSISAISLSIEVAGRRLTINQVGFLGTDPRLLFIPLPQQVVTSTGLETFPLALQPERWEEAVLVKNDESNFGRTDFRRLTSSDRFLKMERPTLGELFADFASSRGDLAFTKNGQFIGALTDTNHAVVINGFLAAAVVNIGNNYKASDHVDTIDRLKDRVRKLPREVQ